MGVQARSVALAERMGNWDADEARRYHERTKHSFESVRASAHHPTARAAPRPAPLNLTLGQALACFP